MTNQIKTIIRNYLSNAKLCRFLSGTVESDGIRIDTKLVVPFELIKGDLKNYVSVGDKVKLLQNHGGQEYYILEIQGLPVATKGRTLQIEPIVVTEGMTISSIKIKEVIK